MKALATTVTALSLSLLVGCASEIPLPTAYEKSYQPKMWAAHHWNVLAADVAERLATALHSAGEMDQPHVLYIAKPGVGSTFNGAFHDLLTTQLMQQGFGVTLVPSESNLVVQYDVKSGGLADKNIETGYTEVEAPDKDILVNVSVLRGTRYVTRISEIFYVDKKTSGEYLAAPPLPPTRLVEVVGS